MKRAAIISLVVIAAVYLGAVGYLQFSEIDLVFPRESAVGGYPQAADSLRLPYRTVTFRTADSVLLSAWEVPADPPSGMWVLL
ncbi:MAG: hypothetical protein ABIR58_05545 [Gemmatimonadaceae bacterium]